MHRFISTELHLSAIGTETINSDKRTIYISDYTSTTLFCQENVRTLI